MKLGIWILIIIAIGTIAGVFVYFFAGKPGELNSAVKSVSSSVTSVAWKPKQRGAITGLLTEQSKGRDGKSFFCTESDAVTFFSPKAWDVVDEVSIAEEHSVFTVRVDSTNGLGMPISKLWSFTVDKKVDDYCVRKIEDKQKVIKTGD